MSTLTTYPPGIRAAVSRSDARFVGVIDGNPRCEGKVHRSAVTAPLAVLVDLVNGDRACRACAARRWTTTEDHIPGGSR